MRYLRHRYHSALDIINSYPYPEPFHLHLKRYFSTHKQFGSKDRKEVSEVCYRYFRCGFLNRKLTVSQGLVAAFLIFFIKNKVDWDKWSDDLPFPHLDEDFFELDIRGRYKKIKDIFNYSDCPAFYHPDYTEDAISANFCDFQPAVWLRCTDEQLLAGKNAERSELLTNAWRLKERVDINHPKIQFQDLGSQFICDQIAIEDNQKVWDCCSGSGGKSLNLLSKCSSEFYLSDKRETSLTNAKTRLTKAGFSKVRFAQADLEKSLDSLDFGELTASKEYFDIILADVPCSGSGTWFRNPEHFIYFDYEDLKAYTIRQKKIVLNALPFLKPGGKLYYITCSVFKIENRELVNQILKDTELQLQSERIFNGQENRADTLYMAELILPE